MAQHYLIKEEISDIEKQVKELVVKAIKNPTSLKWNVEEYPNVRERIDRKWLESVDKIKVSEKQIDKAKVFFVRIWKPKKILRELTKEDWNEYCFEVFQFENKFVVYWVA